MVPYFAPKPLRGGALKGWKVKMCEGGPPSLSLVGSLSFLLRPADAGLRRTCRRAPATGDFGLGKASRDRVR